MYYFPCISKEFEAKWLHLLKNQVNNPTIRGIFRQYSNLYPVMRNIVNLDSYYDCTSKLNALVRSFNSPFESSRYMPVTRDLSGMNLLLINTWLSNPIYCDSLRPSNCDEYDFFGPIQTVEELKEYLQLAIELELSTLPPYLSALYSIDHTSMTNAKIIRFFEQIVHEEMTHMALACNMLRSIGGRPRIADKEVLERIKFPRRGLIRQYKSKTLTNYSLQK